MAEDGNPFKKYNEQIKTFETLARRESELLQKLSQADAERDAGSKLKWARELVEVEETIEALQGSRVRLLTAVRDDLKKQAGGTTTE